MNATEDEGRYRPIVSDRTRESNAAAGPEQSNDLGGNSREAVAKLDLVGNPDDRSECRFGCSTQTNRGRKSTEGEPQVTESRTVEREIQAPLRYDSIKEDTFVFFQSDRWCRAVTFDERPKPNERMTMGNGAELTTPGCFPYVPRHKVPFVGPDRAPRLHSRVL